MDCEAVTTVYLVSWASHEVITNILFAKKLLNFSFFAKNFSRKKWLAKKYIQKWNFSLRLKGKKLKRFWISCRKVSRRGARTLLWKGDKLMHLVLDKLRKLEKWLYLLFFLVSGFWCNSVFCKIEWRSRSHQDFMISSTVVIVDETKNTCQFCIARFSGKWLPLIFYGSCMPGKFWITQFMSSCCAWDFKLDQV